MHDLYRALVVRQPLADRLTRTSWRDADGAYHAEVSLVCRLKDTRYRGDVLVCSSSRPAVPGHESAVTCGLVELYATKPVGEFTEEDWVETGIPEAQRPRKGYGWLFRNPRRVVEMPMDGVGGFYDMALPKDDITEYPRIVMLGEDGHRMACGR